MMNKCNCKICKWLRSLKYKNKKELIDTIVIQSEKLEFKKLYEDTLMDAIKYITPNIWNSEVSSLIRISEFREYLLKLKMMEELRK